MSFQRENRYFVLKVTDIKSFLSEEELDNLHDIAATIDKARKAQGKDTLECVLIESGWPEYEIVWKMIQDRVEGGPTNSPNSAPRTPSCERMLRGIGGCGKTSADA